MMSCISVTAPHSTPHKGTTFLALSRLFISLVVSGGLAVLCVLRVMAQATTPISGGRGEDGKLYKILAWWEE